MKLAQLNTLLQQYNAAISQEAILAELITRPNLPENERKEFTAMHIAAKREVERLGEKKL